MVRFSIVVVALNAEKYIRKTIESVLCQTYQNFEVIVKDGLSKDNTLNEIPHDDHIRVYQEKDSSLYDAMNQATRYSTGEYVLYLNCGDVFASTDVLEEVAKFLSEHTDCDLLYGDYSRDVFVSKQASSITNFYLYRTPLCHQTIFFKTDLIRSKFPYDTSFRILADYNVELGMLKAGCSFMHIDKTICHYLGGGISETKEGIAKKNDERKLLLKKHFTLRERLLYGARLALTLPKARKFLNSSKSPMIVRTAYKTIVNRINTK